MPIAAIRPHRHRHQHMARLARVLRVLLLLLHLLLDTRLLLGLRNDFDLILQTTYVFSNPREKVEFMRSFLSRPLEFSVLFSRLLFSSQMISDRLTFPICFLSLPASLFVEITLLHIPPSYVSSPISSLINTFAVLWSTLLSLTFCFCFRPHCSAVSASFLKENTPVRRLSLDFC